MATQNMLTVFQFQVDEVDGKYDNIEYTMKNTQLTAFSICFYFKPKYRGHIVDSRMYIWSTPDVII